MAAFTRLQRWLRVGKDKESISSPKWGLGLKELDNVRFPSLVKGSTISSSTRKAEREWKKREEMKIDKEHDAILVTVLDDSCLSSSLLLSGSESDDSDWSVGWVEPHAPHFQSDDEASNSFAVLVPCYRRECKDLKSTPENMFIDSINYLPLQFNDSRKYVEQWLSSLQQY